MSDGSSTKKRATPYWGPRLATLLARRRHADAFKLLERMIQEDLGLFRDLPEVLEDRRTAWLCRIDLLRERGRLAEALAWTCLECELNPGNVTAQALKEQLERSIHLGVPRASFGNGDDPPPDGWDGVAGMRELKAILERDVILPLQEPELYRRYKVDLPNGILLYGPPGCGKTFIARALGKRISYEFMEVMPSDLASVYVHGTQGKIGELFKKAEKAAPTILFFDELDALVPDRSGLGVDHHYATEVNEFLVQLNESSKRRILVVGATNLLRKVDPAVKRPGRLDKHIFVGPPDVEARVDAIKLCMRERPQDQIDWVGVAEAAENYSFAELEFVVNEAARSALAQRRNITAADLLTALKQNPPQPKGGKVDFT